MHGDGAEVAAMITGLRGRGVRRGWTVGEPGSRKRLCVGGGEMLRVRERGVCAAIVSVCVCRLCVRERMVEGRAVHCVRVTLHLNGHRLIVCGDTDAVVATFC